jgi:hypothetical protein
VTGLDTERRTRCNPAQPIRRPAPALRPKWRHRHPLPWLLACAAYHAAVWTLLLAAMFHLIP